MAGGSNRAEREAGLAGGAAILMLQLAASHAGIGPFASRNRETPQAASRSYARVDAGERPRTRLARLA